jgi:Ca-activated chloride channel homolog
MTFRFADPAALILLLILPVLMMIWHLAKSRKVNLGFPTIKTLAAIPGAVSSKPVWIPRCLRIVVIILLIITAARPQRGDIRDIVYSDGIDIVIALDISGSMRAVDFQPLNRFEMAKKVIASFVDARKNDRIGMVLFGGEAFTACPLTLDHALLKMILDQTFIGMVEEHTAIGKAIAVSLNRLRTGDRTNNTVTTEASQETDHDKVIILATDGVNNVFTGMDPITAARAAHAMNIRIYTIGIGQKGTSPFPHPRIPGRYVQIPAELDEDSLREIAAITGGEYFRAESSDALNRIFNIIDQMEKRPIESYTYVRYAEMYVWFLIPALFFLMIERVLCSIVYRRFP